MSRRWSSWWLRSGRPPDVPFGAVFAGFFRKRRLPEVLVSVNPCIQASSFLKCAMEFLYAVFLLCQTRFEAKRATKIVNGMLEILYAGKYFPGTRKNKRKPCPRGVFFCGEKNRREIGGFGADLRGNACPGGQKFSIEKRTELRAAFSGNPSALRSCRRQKGLFFPQNKVQWGVQGRVSLHRSTYCARSAVHEKSGAFV